MTYAHRPSTVTAGAEEAHRCCPSPAWKFQASPSRAPSCHPCPCHVYVGLPPLLTLADPRPQEDPPGLVYAQCCMIQFGPIIVQKILLICTALGGCVPIMCVCVTFTCVIGRFARSNVPVTREIQKFCSQITSSVIFVYYLVMQFRITGRLARE